MRHRDEERPGPGRNVRAPYAQPTVAVMSATSTDPQATSEQSGDPPARCLS